MPHKAKNKPASNDTAAFKLSGNMEHFLALMNQNHQIVLMDLLTMKFIKVDEPITASLSNTVPIEVDNETNDISDGELTPAEDLINTIAHFGKWFQSNNIPNDTHSGLIDNTSEAASQTPAPSHEASRPPPSSAAVASIPPTGPHACASYAGTAAKNLNPAAPPFMCGPPHVPVAQPPAQAQQPVSSKHLKQLFFAMRGPSHCQFFIEVPTIPKDTSLPSMVKTANNALACTKSTLWVDLACFSPCGIMCATANVPSTSDLNIIKATLTGRLLRVRICIPASRSFIKIMDVPFFKPGMTEPIPSAEVGTQLQHSNIPSNYIMHWHFVQNSPKAKFTTMWIDLSDSQ
ncbi:hypothetical protein P691DRAFT_789474 [Macrolepiota fuliginosa MF-IS2]|uniref:Uncharacterized protein n=1 Tax=Macrolepiota fuliginosa MF-IS2 TaxID=1400762 RepID=A0A9P5X2X3_9AGAR|nr:hypothetical protein P691DRAFT_789474 [Macrolepiota fuliginosa MF-IS2]